MIKTTLALALTAGTVSLSPIPAPDAITLTAGPVELVHETQTGLQLSLAQKPGIAVTVKTKNGKALKISF